MDIYNAYINELYKLAKKEHPAVRKLDRMATRDMDFDIVEAGPLRRFLRGARRRVSHALYHATTPGIDRVPFSGEEKQMLRKGDVARLVKHLNLKASDYGHKGLGPNSVAMPLRVYSGGAPRFKEFKRAWNIYKGTGPARLMLALDNAVVAGGTSDMYNPATHSVHLFTRSPHIALHELGHAKDLNKFRLHKKTNRGLGVETAPLTVAEVLRQERAASAHAASFKKLTAADKARGKHVLTKAYGTYLMHSPVDTMHHVSGFGSGDKSGFSAKTIAKEKNPALRRAKEFVHLYRGGEELRKKAAYEAERKRLIKDLRVTYRHRFAGAGASAAALVALLALRIGGRMLGRMTAGAIRKDFVPTGHLADFYETYRRNAQTPRLIKAVPDKHFPHFDKAVRDYLAPARTAPKPTPFFRNLKKIS